MSQKKILIVDDEVVMREYVSQCLTNEGFIVLKAGDSESAFELVRSHRPDLIILDIILPGLDGIEFCRELRKDNNVPIIFLTSKNDFSDIILGMGIGGDDYITKPFNTGEMIARVKANLRRSQMGNKDEGFCKQEDIFRYSGLEVNLAECNASVEGSPVNLTAKEFTILSIFCRSPNRVFRVSNLLDLADVSDERTMMVHISRLRKKIEKDPAKPVFIITVRGIGYKFSAKRL